VFLKQGTLITKKELVAFKEAAKNKELDIIREIQIPSKTKAMKNQCMTVECVDVYQDNDRQIE
jgi:hypothetical protein